MIVPFDDGLVALGKALDPRSTARLIGVEAISSWREGIVEEVSVSVGRDGWEEEVGFGRRGETLRADGAVSSEAKEEGTGLLWTNGRHYQRKVSLEKPKTKVRTADEEGLIGLQRRIDVPEANVADNVGGIGRILDRGSSVVADTGVDIRIGERVEEDVGVCRRGQRSVWARFNGIPLKPWVGRETAFATLLPL